MNCSQVIKIWICKSKTNNANGFITINKIIFIAPFLNKLLKHMCTH